MEQVRVFLIGYDAGRVAMRGGLNMDKKKVSIIVAVCAAVSAALGTVVFFIIRKHGEAEK